MRKTRRRPDTLPRSHCGAYLSLQTVYAPTVSTPTRPAPCRHKVPVFTCSRRWERLNQQSGGVTAPPLCNHVFLHTLWTCGWSEVSHVVGEISRNQQSDSITSRIPDCFENACDCPIACRRNADAGGSDNSNSLTLLACRQCRIRKLWSIAPVVTQWRNV